MSSNKTLEQDLVVSSLQPSSLYSCLQITPRKYVAKVHSGEFLWDIYRYNSWITLKIGFNIEILSFSCGHRLRPMWSHEAPTCTLNITRSFRTRPHVSFVSHDIGRGHGMRPCVVIVPPPKFMHDDFVRARSLSSEV